MNRWFVFFLFTILITPHYVGAQFSGDLLGQSLAITLNPAYPAPNERVVATIDDYSLGIYGAKINWSLDGQVATSTLNEREVVFYAPEVGQTSKLKVSITSPTGLVFEAERTIKPIYLDLIIEPQTYSPQFYKGRSLPTIGSYILATALVQTEKGIVDPSEYSYLWRVNDTTIGGGGKIGGLQTLYTVPQGKSHIVTVEIHDRNGTLLTRRSSLVKTSEVDLKLHVVDPLYGLSSSAINGSMAVSSNNITVRAIPYNLDLRITNSNLFSEWRLNNQVINQDFGDPFLVSIDRGNFGLVNLVFKLRHKEALLQGGEVGVSLRF